MANGTVKKIGKAAGQKDVDTEIRVLEVVQQVRGKSEAELQEPRIPLFRSSAGSHTLSDKSRLVPAYQDL